MKQSGRAALSDRPVTRSWSAWIDAAHAAGPRWRVDDGKVGAGIGATLELGGEPRRRDREHDRQGRGPPVAPPGRGLLRIDLRGVDWRDAKLVGAMMRLWSFQPPRLGRRLVSRRGHELQQRRQQTLLNLGRLRVDALVDNARRALAVACHYVQVTHLPEQLQRATDGAALAGRHVRDDANQVVVFDRSVPRSYSYGSGQKSIAQCSGVPVVLVTHAPAPAGATPHPLVTLPTETEPASGGATTGEPEPKG